MDGTKLLGTFTPDALNSDFGGEIDDVNKGMVVDLADNSLSESVW